jgi:hypothetical protein
MKKIPEKIFHKKGQTNKPDLLDEFITTEQEVKKLRQLSDVERVQFEQDIAVSHLYHSSKIEGSQLNQERLNKAIHA